MINLSKTAITVRVFFLFILLSLAGCIYQKYTFKDKNNITLKEFEFNELDNWENANFRDALRSFLNSCDKFANMSHKKIIAKQFGDITAEDFYDNCEIAFAVRNLSDSQIKNFFENWFKPFLVIDDKNNEKGLFTGYYEAKLNGSLKKDEKYKYPIYSYPEDKALLQHTREEIEKGALDEKNLELIYVDDYADLFFLHIQGSGRIFLDNGKVIRIGFAGKNSHGYSSIGRDVMNRVNQSTISSKNTTTPEKMKTWIRDNLDEAKTILAKNKSYIFFKITKDVKIYGASGVPLIAESSIAIDNNFVPFGFPLWLETTINLDGSHKKFNKILLPQDTGSAIKGPIRGDVFFGFGDEAYKKASSMHSYGKYYILIPTNIVHKIKKIKKM